MEQRVNLKFLIKLGKTFAKAYAMLKEVYGNDCLSRTQRGVKRPKTIRAPDNNQRQLNNESFNMRKVCAKTVPKLLTLEQKESRMNIWADILNNKRRRF
ncbi:hypothetical protein NQ318_019357 [Aromia moschata]|uniref:Uncharacterized protein n=1 Tax=Aromia moschata TaxID=1265417 RepID=A0AAV8YA10_9CUCU|nr:hypothetical protein NQ318_019357 [Aromia moschata]